MSPRLWTLAALKEEVGSQAGPCPATRRARKAGSGARTGASATWSWGAPWVVASAKAGSGQEGGHPGHSGLLISCPTLRAAALGLSGGRLTLHPHSGPVCFSCDEGGCSTPAQRTPSPGPP